MFKIGFEIQENVVSAARSEAGLVSSWPLLVARFRATGLGNLLVGAILKTRPGSADARPNELRACAKAFNGAADSNRRQALSGLANAIDGANIALREKGDFVAAEAAIVAAFGDVVRAFQITNDGGEPLQITNMPEPEDRRGDGDDAETEVVVKRGKRRAE